MRFHDAELARLAELARRHDAKMFGFGTIFNAVGALGGDLVRGAADVATGNFSGAAGQVANVVNDTKSAIQGAPPEVQSALQQGVNATTQALQNSVNDTRNAAANVVAQAGIGAAGIVGAPGNWYEYIVEHPGLPMFVGLVLVIGFIVLARKD